MRVIYRLHSHDLNAVASEASWAEAMGYDGVSSSETSNDPFIPLILAATSTSRVTLETRVAIAFPRSPMVVAHTSRDLQDLSRGRFRLGLGTQVKGHIERRFSTLWEPPGPRLREYVESLRHIWDCWANGSRLDYQGKHYQFSLMTPFFNPGPSAYEPPHVFAGAVNGYNCRVAGEVCDGLMLHSLTSAEYVRDIVRPGVAQGADRAERPESDIKVSGGGFIITGPNQSSIRKPRPGSGGESRSMLRPAPTSPYWNATDSTRSVRSSTRCHCEANGRKWGSLSAMKCSMPLPSSASMTR